MHRGCEKGQACGYSGMDCGNSYICENCTFEECLQHATESNSFAFAYRATGGKYCRLCDVNQLKYVGSSRDWGVYKSASKLQSILHSMSHQ